MKKSRALNEIDRVVSALTMQLKADLGKFLLLEEGGRPR